MSVDEQTELLREMRDLLRVIAEPALAERDAKLRAALKEIVGTSAKRAVAVSLMDGSRKQATIQKDSGIDKGNLSRLVKSMRDANLLGPDEKNPKIVIPTPVNFLARKSGQNE